jgi:hypothetical protein
MVVLAREASDRVDPTASSVGHIVNNGRDSVGGGGRRLHPHDTTGDPARSVSVTMAEVCVQLLGLGRPLTRSMRPSTMAATVSTVVVDACATTTPRGTLLAAST